MTLEQIRNLTVQELEQLFPGPYLIYKVEEYQNEFGIHIGCTRNMKNRERGHKHKSSCLPVVIFETMSLYEAEEKEREIKSKYGMPTGNVSYINDLRRQIVSTRKEVRKKAIDNTDFEKKYNKKVRQKMSKCKDNIKVPVKAYTVPKPKKGSRRRLEDKVYLETFESFASAAKALGITAADIAHILSPNYYAKTRKGYTFEYAEKDTIS